MYKFILLFLFFASEFQLLMIQTAYYLENVTLPCYLPHLDDWPFKSDDKINWHFSVVGFATVIFSLKFVSVNNWIEDYHNVQFEPISFSHGSTDQLSITIANAKRSYFGQYWCEAAGGKRPIRSKSIQLDISSM